LVPTLPVFEGRLGFFLTRFAHPRPSLTPSLRLLCANASLTSRPTSRLRFSSESPIAFQHSRALIFEIFCFPTSSGLPIHCSFAPSSFPRLYWLSVQDFKWQFRLPLSPPTRIALFLLSKRRSSSSPVHAVAPLSPRATGLTPTSLLVLVPLLGRSPSVFPCLHSGKVVFLF